jgi:hypothetical protein
MIGSIRVDPRDAYGLPPINYKTWLAEGDVIVEHEITITPPAQLVLTTEIDGRRLLLYKERDTGVADINYTVAVWIKSAEGIEIERSILVQVRNL